MVNLFPHQQKAVQELGNGKVLWGDVGTGKSLTAMAYYAAREAPKDVYVITTAKKRDSLDWPKEAAKFSVSTHEGVGIAKLTVDSWNNIDKYIGVENAFFIFDEQRLVGTGSWVKSFYKVAARNHWIMLTATPGDVWLDYAPIFIANGWYKNITQFRSEHVLYTYHSKFPKVAGYIGEARLRRLRTQVLVEMPYLRHTKRHVNNVFVKYDKTLFEKVAKDRWHVYENRPLRDVSELFSVMRKVANSDSSRTQAVRSLLEEHPKLIVFYNFDYELHALREMAESWSSRKAGRPSRSPASSTSMARSRESESSGRRPTPTSTPTTTTAGASRSTSKPARRTEGWPTTKIQESKESSKSSTTTPTGAFQQKGGGGTSSHSSARRTEGWEQPSSTSSSTRQVLNSSSTSSRTGAETFAIAEWNGHKHEPIPTTDSWLYLVQYQAGAEGWNCIETDAMCFYSLTYSYKLYYQAHGRIDRLNTPYTDLHYYQLVSKSMIDQAVQRSLTSKQSFNESAYLKSGGFV